MSIKNFRPDSEGYNLEAFGYGELENISPLLENNGVNYDTSVVGYHPTGRRVYVKDADLWIDDTVQSHIAAGIFMDNLDYPTPDIAYDGTFKKILVEEMPGEITDGWEEQQMRPLHRAVAQKMLMGDSDYAGNFLATKAGVNPVDHDLTGRDIRTVKRTIYSAIGDVIEQDILHQEASKMARKVDLESLEQEMRDEEYLMSEWEHTGEMVDPVAWKGLFRGSIDNIVNNVEMFQRR